MKNNKRKTKGEKKNYKYIISIEYGYEEKEEEQEERRKQQPCKHIHYSIFDSQTKEKIGPSTIILTEEGRKTGIEKAILQLTRSLSAAVKHEYFCIIVNQDTHQKFLKACEAMHLSLPKFFYKYFTIQQEFSNHLLEMVNKKKTNKEERQEPVEMKNETRKNEATSKSDKIVIELLKQGHLFEEPFVLDTYHKKTTFKPKFEPKSFEQQNFIPSFVPMMHPMQYPMFYGTVGNGHIKLQTTTKREKKTNHKLTPSHKYKFHRQPVDPTTCKVIRLRGLPWTSTKQDIIDFFKTLEFEEPCVPQEKAANDDEEEEEEDSTKPKFDPAKDFPHILLMISQDGRSTGEAYLRLKNPDEAAKAMKKDREYMGRRYIEVFYSSEEEFKHCEHVAKLFQEQLDDSHVIRMKPCPTPDKALVTEFFKPYEIDNLFIWRKEPPGMAFIRFKTMKDVEGALKKDQSLFKNRHVHVSRSTDHDMTNAIKDVMNRKHVSRKRQQHHQQPPFLPMMPMQPYFHFPQQMPSKIMMPPPPPFSQTPPPSFSQIPSSQSYIVRLRGLPFEADEVDIDDFFDGIEIVESGIHMIVSNKDNKKKTGEAFVEFATEAALRAALAKNKELMDDRYIEIFHASQDDMNELLAKPIDE